jgi:hypothetical protein
MIAAELAEMKMITLARATPVLLLMFHCASPLAQKPAPKLSATLDKGRFQVGIAPAANLAYSVEASEDLKTWEQRSLMIGSGGFSGPVLPYVDPAFRASGSRFYRVIESAITPTNDWRNNAFLKNDEFLSPRISFGEDEIRWLKFAITANDSYRVYFQDSGKYLFHYDFATARLPGFKGLTRAQFDDVSLRTNNQQVVLGTLLYEPGEDPKEVGIQFVGADAYSREQIANWFEAVRAAIVAEGGWNALYLPTYEQATVAAANADFFSGRGIEVSSVLRWTGSASVYSQGWAIGTLKYFPTPQIQAAYTDGRLGPVDILLTDDTPAELPYVSGILCLKPATPNSHVAILAHSYGIPFAFLGTPELKATAQALLGKQVIVGTSNQGFRSSVVRLLDATNLTPALREEMLAAKQPPSIQLAPKARFGQYIAATDNLVPSDIKFFGGKAANYGFLRRAIPSNSHPAIAISFDLWDDFLDQALTTGKTLREEIDLRLSKYHYPPAPAELAADLKAIRDLITGSTQFTETQKSQLAAALLGMFDPKQNIRFRSSTNVEDTETFTGAGLYDSYSGCLDDDLDSDSTGPSLCDPTETNERGVFRAIRKVYASFYNDNAFMERLRRGVDETKIGMAILVHYSSPDENELANGVATIAYQNSSFGTSYQALMVTQKGAVSVTNPGSSAIAESVDVSQFSFGSRFAELKQRSSLVPLGGTVLQWEQEYYDFGDLFLAVSQKYREYYVTRTNYTLDFEYKKIVPGDLLVKQVRTIPAINPDATQQTFFINQPQQWCVFEGEYGDVFANHRLKSKFLFRTRDLKPELRTLSTTIFHTVDAEYLLDGSVSSLDGSPSTWPGAKHAAQPQDGSVLVSDSWIAGTNATYSVEAQMRTNVSLRESPVLVLADLDVVLRGNYVSPVWGFNNFGEEGQVKEDSARLIPCPVRHDTDIPVVRTVSLKSVSIKIEFYWPLPPGGFAAGYTAPLVAWKGTTIEGLTSKPITLQGYYSQTYRPQHHNFAEDFLFEPRLEPGIDPQVLAELEAKDIIQIVTRWSGFDDPPSIRVIGKDGKPRPLP